MDDNKTKVDLSSLQQSTVCFIKYAHYITTLDVNVIHKPYLS